MDDRDEIAKWVADSLVTSSADVYANVGSKEPGDITTFFGDEGAEALANDAYKIADAMMRVRERSTRKGHVDRSDDLLHKCIDALCCDVNWDTKHLLIRHNFFGVKKWRAGGSYETDYGSIRTVFDDSMPFGAWVLEVRHG